MKEFWIVDDYADFKPINVGYVPKQGLRAYKWCPSGAIIQIRTKTGKQGRMSIVHMNKKELEEFANALIEIAKELE